MKKEYIIKEMELQYSRIGELIEIIKKAEKEDPEYRDNLKEASYLSERLDENFMNLLEKERYERIATGFKGMQWGKRR